MVNFLGTWSPHMDSEIRKVNSRTLIMLDKGLNPLAEDFIPNSRHLSELYNDRKFYNDSLILWRRGLNPLAEEFTLGNKDLE